MVKIAFIYADTQSEWNVSQWRSLTPANNLNKYGKDKVYARLMGLQDFAHFGHPAVQEWMGQFDWLIIQRNIFYEPIWDACDYWRMLGKVVCADLDDDYPRLTPQNPAHHFWKGEGAEGVAKDIGNRPVDGLVEGLRHVDALLSPNRLILDDWADVVPGYMLRNYAEPEWYEGMAQRPVPGGDEPIILGWGGSVSHFDSWWFSGAKEAIVELLEQRPQAKLKLCGNDFRLKQWFKGSLPANRWIDQEGVPPDKWPAIVQTFDVGLAPLVGPGAPQEEAYDQRRSFIKASEYLLCGVPWVATRGPVYEELCGQGGVCVENTKEAWLAALLDMVDNLAERKATSRDLMGWAFENLTMIGHVDTYVNLFNRIKAEKQAVQGARLPNVMYVNLSFKEGEEDD